MTVTDDAVELGLVEAEPDEERVPDADAILPPPARLEIDGIPVEIRRLKARELLALMQVVTFGLGPEVANMRFDAGATQEEVAGKILGMLIAAVPNAGDYFLSFVRLITDPADGDDKTRAALQRSLENPEIEVVLDVLETMVLQEQEDLESLVGRVKAMFRRIQAAYGKTGAATAGPLDRLPPRST